MKIPLKMILSYLWWPLIIFITFGFIIYLVIASLEKWVPLWLAIGGAIIIFLSLQVLIGMNLDGRFDKQ